MQSPNLALGSAGREVGGQVTVSSSKETQTSRRPTERVRYTEDHNGLQLRVGVHLQGNEPHLNLVITIIKVTMHALLFTCLKFSMIRDHNFLHLLNVVLQHLPLERGELMQEIFCIYL